MKKCKRCDKDFEPKNPKGVFCSDKCKVYWHRENPKSLEAIPAPKEKSDTNVPVEAKKVNQEVASPSNAEILEKIKAVQNEAKPSFFNGKQFEIYKERKISNLKKQL